MSAICSQSAEGGVGWRSNLYCGVNSTGDLVVFIGLNIKVFLPLFLAVQMLPFGDTRSTLRKTRSNAHRGVYDK